MVSTQSVSLELSKDIYDHFVHLAERTGRPVEDVMLETLEAKARGTNFDPDAVNLPLDKYDDDQLWAVLEQRIPWSERERFRKIVERRETRPLTPEEEAELDALVERFDALTLVRSEALMLLKQRGYDVDTYLFAYR